MHNVKEIFFKNGLAYRKTAAWLELTFQRLGKKMIAIGDLPSSTQNGLKSNEANYG
jgi:hypothetical protein